MSLKRTVALIVGATAVMAGGVSFGAAPGKPTLSSGKAARKPAPIVMNKKLNAPDATELLFRGDMAADIGLGCSNSAGTTGGPNDWATKVTATLTPPFGITTTTYNIFSFNSGPTWDVVAWQNGATPGAEIGRTPLGAGAGTNGNHTVAVAPPIVVPAGQQTFFFGLSQGADTNGVRIGMDTGGSTPGTTFIRAPTCGAGTFFDVITIGYPGFWVQSVLVDDAVPVELMNFSVS